jgi:type I restriction enzyme R subunit
MVKHQMTLILEVQTDSFWEEVTPEDLDRVRRALRELVKLIERKIVYTDFTDEIGAGTEVAINAVAPGIDKLRFTMKVRRFLERHKDHIALQKLRRAEQLTKTDIAELERMFLDDGVSVDDTVPEITTAGGLGLFLRSLIGLDRKSAKQAFSALTEGRTLNGNQTEFLDLVINHLTERGVIDPARFYESPYTDLSDQGISGVFPQAVVQDIRLKAVA